MWEAVFPWGMIAHHVSLPAYALVRSSRSPRSTTSTDPTAYDSIPIAGKIRGSVQRVLSEALARLRCSHVSASPGSGKNALPYGPTKRPKRRLAGSLYLGKKKREKSSMFLKVSELGGEIERR